MSVYVVTGGAGFIGSSIVDRLVAEENEVRVVDDFSTGRRDNLAEPTDEVFLFEGSVCDRELLMEVFSGADYVLHQAAVPSVQASIEDPATTNRVNVDGTLNVLTAARDCGVRRVVYASSSAVYGDAPGQPKREDMAPAPVSPYAVSKLAGEHYCLAFHAVYGLETVALRYFNVYGPRQDPASGYAAVVPAFIGALHAGTPPRVFGDGEQTRDFVYVEDVVRANLLAASVDGAAGAVLNIGSGRTCSLNELLALLNEVMPPAVEPLHVEERAGDIKHSSPDVNKARDVLGFEPSVELRDGLAMTADWYRSKNAPTLFVVDPDDD